MPEIGPTREHVRWAAARSVDWNEDTVSQYDAVVIATAHRSVNYAELSEWATCIVDTRNVMSGVRGGTAKVWNA